MTTQALEHRYTLTAAGWRVVRPRLTVGEVWAWNQGQASAPPSAKR